MSVAAYLGRTDAKSVALVEMAARAGRFDVVEKLVRIRVLQKLVDEHIKEIDALMVDVTKTTDGGL